MSFTSQDVGRVSHLHPTTLQVSRLPRKPQALRSRHAISDALETAEAYSWRTACLPLRYPAPPSIVRMSKSALCLASASLTRHVSEAAGGRQQARRHAVSPVVSAVQLGEILVFKQLPTHRGQQTIEAPTTNVVYVQPVGLPQASRSVRSPSMTALPHRGLPGV